MLRRLRYLEVPYRVLRAASPLFQAQTFVGTVAASSPLSLLTSHFSPFFVPTALTALGATGVSITHYERLEPGW